MSILTICIPTYNLAGDLNNLLQDLCKFARKIPIVVSDNASDDDTSKIINIYKKKNKFIKYYKLKKHKSFDQNYLNCVSKANTQYFWCLGADERIYKNSVKIILKLLKKNPDGITFSDKNSLINKKIQLKKKNFFNFKIEKHIHYLGCISLNIINTKKIKELIKLYVKKKHYNYIQLFYTIAMVYKTNHWIFYDDSICYINKESIKKNLNKKKFIKRLDSEIKSYIKPVRHYYSFNQKLYKKILNQIYKKNIRPWIAESILNAGTMKTLQIIYKNIFYLKDINYMHLYILFIKIFPQFFIKSIIKSKRFFYNGQ